MAMGRRRKQTRELWIDTMSLAKAPGHPFYEKLSTVLNSHGFEPFVENLCTKFYGKTGRPSIPPAVYFRLNLVGYFEGIDSDRGMAWRLADSITIREFAGYELTEQTPDHSTISRTRRLLDIKTHDAVFAWVLEAMAKAGLLKGERLGIDATTLEANAAMRSIKRRDGGGSYTDFVKKLAEEAGVEDPNQEDIARFDRKRKGRKTSNRDWEHPHDPDARITKMKDGTTRLGHKAEHAVDMETGAIVSVTVQPADRGDTKSLEQTLEAAAINLDRVLDNPEAGAHLAADLLTELVTDKGYHSNEVLLGLQNLEIRTYIAEPDRGRRNWKGKQEERDAVYANRRRVRGKRGRSLLRERGELLERPFAHCYETGGMRRTHLRGHENILKRLLIHVAGFNLALLMRKSFGKGTPRGLQGLSFALDRLLSGLRTSLKALLAAAGVHDVIILQFRPLGEVEA